MKRVIFILTISTWCFWASAQHAFSYRDCADYALQHNRELQNSELNIEIQQLNVNRARFSFLPYVEASSSFELNTGKTIDPNTNATVENNFYANNYHLGGSWLLFSGFQRCNRIAFEKYNRNVVKQQTEQKTNEVLYSLLEVYTAYLFNKELVEIQEQHLEITKKELQKVEKMIDMGRAANSEQFEAQARLANDEYLVLQSKNAVQQSEFKIRILMNYPPDSTISFMSLSSVVTLTDIPLQDSIVQAANKNLPQIQILENQYLASCKQLAVERGSLSPQLSFYSGINTGYYETVKGADGRILGFSNQININKRINYGLQLQIPIFDGWSKRLTIRKASITKIQAQNSLQSGIESLRYEIRSAITAYEAAIKEYQAAIKKEVSEKMAFDAAQKKYDKGLISIMLFFEAKNKLMQAQSELIRTHLQVYIKQTNLRFYETGKVLAN